MADYDDELDRDRRRVVLAWIILILQIIILLWLLLFARDRFVQGAEPPATVAPTTVAAVEDEATAVPEVDEQGTADAEAANAQATTDAQAAADAQVTADAEPTAEPTAAAVDAGVLPAEEVTVDPAPLAEGGATAPEWLAQVVAGTPPDTAAGTAGIPPHLLLTFRDPRQPELELAVPDTIDLNRPQMRIVPIAALLAWLQARGDTAGQEALEDLQLLLEEQPAADEAVVPLPPILADSVQDMVAGVGYQTFTGGEGVGYVGHVTGDSVVPVSNESGLSYLYQGLSADGRHFVFMAWPLSAAFLPDTAAEAETDAVAAQTDDPDGYYRTIATQVEEAESADLSPRLGQLALVLASLNLTGAATADAATDAAQQVSPGSPADVPGIVWNWTASRDAAGEETAVDSPPDYVLVFWPDGSFSFQADCNVGRGETSVAGDGTLTLTPGAMTRAACPDGSRAGEFVETLAAARALGFDESGDMIVTLPDGGSAVFANAGQSDTTTGPDAEAQPDAADAGFTGINLQWPGFSNANGDFVEVDNPENYTIALLPDGTYTFRADCNVGQGTYDYAEDGTLTLIPGPMTLVACEGDSWAGDFLTFLSNVNGVSVGDDGAVTMTTIEGDSAIFIGGGPLTDAGATADTAQDPLLGRVWQWTAFEDSAGLNDLAVDDPESYLLTLLPDGTFTFRADCNVGRGVFTEDNGGLLLEVGPMTRAACGDGSLGDRFVQFLDATATYVLDDDGQLVLNLMADSGNLVFTDGGPAEVAEETADTTEQLAAESIGLSSMTLQWSGFTGSDGNVVEVANPEDYFLALLPDGTFTFKADCNVGSGVYNYADDGTLTLTTLTMTRAACPEGSQADAFLNVLNGVGGVSLDDDGNPTFARADGSSATFVNLGPVEVPADQPDDDAAPEGELLNIVWQWTSLSDAAGTTTEVADPERYTLTFFDDTYNFVADCNQGVGSYTRDGATLSLLPGAMTLVACEAGSLSDEFIGFFDQIAGYDFDGDNLLLTLADGSVLTLANGGPFGEATAAPDEGNAAPLAGTVWRWATFRDAKQDYVVPTTAPYTLEFNDDGTVSVVADCNSGGGTYTVNSDGTLTISVLLRTRAACPPGSLGDSFVEYLNLVGPFEVDDAGMLTLGLRNDGGTMTFTPEE